MRGNRRRAGRHRIDPREEMVGMAEPMELGALEEVMSTAEPVHDHRWLTTDKQLHETHAYECQDCGVSWTM
jgi:hypothetical protein